jgi:hypothetical protein
MILSCAMLGQICNALGGPPELIDCVEEMFAASLRPVGWAPPPLWDPIAGDYRTRDGWIRLHTNAPDHRAAALAVLRLASRRRRRPAGSFAGAGSPERAVTLRYAFSRVRPRC